ncbi:GNAT family N-acetyltransferase [Chitinimonas taiwanensis]|uniref:GNAT family N-acetyltransferase n=1 Tax=Chitinimonas taiwanensis TaxID=240412 RepID=UPI0035AEB5B4
MHLLRLNNAARELIEPDWLLRAEAIHRELRPQLAMDYPAQMRGIFADGGQMVIAHNGEAVLGLAVFRHYRDTFSGTKFYVDDLVTTSQQRSQGVGKCLLDWLQQEALRCGATNFMLDSGTQRIDAHRFYHREGLTIASFNFKKPLQGKTA